MNTIQQLFQTVLIRQVNIIHDDIYSISCGGSGYYLLFYIRSKLILFPTHARTHPKVGFEFFLQRWIDGSDRRVNKQAHWWRGALIKKKVLKLKKEDFDQIQ